MPKSKKDIQPYWRPNFVNTGSLPDIKVVRTNFIINAAALIVFMILGFLVLQKEYRAYTLKNTIGGLEQRIQSASAENKKNLALSESFEKAAAHVVELEKFYMAPFQAHDFLSEVVDLRPEGVIFNEVAVSEALISKKKGSSIIVYEVVISGEVRSLTALDEFTGRVSEWERLAIEGYVSEIEETVRGRNTETGIFPYNLRITLEPEKKKSKKRGAG